MLIGLGEQEARHGVEAGSGLSMTDVSSRMLRRDVMIGGLGHVIFNHKAQTKGILRKQHHIQP